MKSIFALTFLIFYVVAIEHSIAEDFERATHNGTAALQENSCREVNLAYERMYNSGRWSTNGFWLYPDGSTKIAHRMIYFDRWYFEQRDGADYWRGYGRRAIRDAIDHRSDDHIFDNCHFRGIQTTAGQRSSYYEADWKKDGATARTEIWISQASGKFVKNIFHYRKRPDWYDVSNVIQTMDYDRRNAVVPANIRYDGAIALNQSAAAGPQFLDLSCSAVNAAYSLTRNTGRYSETISSPQPDGTLKVFYEMVFHGQYRYEKSTISDLWKTYGPLNWSLYDRTTAKFTDCKFLASENSPAGVVRHFAATWHKQPTVAPMDIWVFQKNGKFAKTIRTSIDAGEPVKLIELFDYNEQTAEEKSRTAAMATPQ